MSEKKRNAKRDGAIAEKLFACTNLNCNKRFTYYDNLMKHISKHSAADKIYNCAECRMAFSRKIYLREHARVHSSNKQYFCIPCNKHFVHKQSFSEHKRWKHSAQKPFLCSECGKPFKSRTRMQSHVLAHQ
jgi:KRAB domain-containing zinc finger protein